MNIEHTLERAFTYASQHRAWLIPTALLLLSHLIFASGGALAGLVSLPLCYAALHYYAKSRT